MKYLCTCQKDLKKKKTRKFTKTLKKYGLKQLRTDKCIFKKKDNSAILAVHVDDGIQIKQGREGIKLNQQNYSERILETYGMSNSKPVDTPILANAEINDGGSRTKSFPFREAVGSLLYLTAKTRPDLSYAVTYNSRNTQNSSDVDVTNIKRILR
ncbi:uncharacterized protein [Temnothorax nylanderi]|uniref:uncharacterized protein n=1 Tax=Temnothorax nylanderi TaxID=102681 RepID=UPI003A8B383B